MSELQCGSGIIFQKKISFFFFLWWLELNSSGSLVCYMHCLKYAKDVLEKNKTKQKRLNKNFICHLLPLNFVHFLSILQWTGPRPRGEGVLFTKISLFSSSLFSSILHTLLPLHSPPSSLCFNHKYSWSLWEDRYKGG